MNNNLSRDNLYKQIFGYQSIDDQESSDQATMLLFMDSFEDTVTRNNIFGHFTASAFVVNESGTKVLLLRHNIFNDCVYPGGHADGEYDLLSVAIREVEEETGLISTPLNYGEIFSLQCIPVKGHLKDGKYISPHIHYDVAFLLEAKDADMDKIRVLESENSEVYWAQIDDARLDVMADWFKCVYSKFKKKFGGNRYA